MHGDFSRWFGKIPKNQIGILAQEGRILLDADVNAHALLGARWQDFAARAAFGARIAAIPADTPEAWKVVGAAINQGTVTVSVVPGVAWADGLLVELDGVPPRPVQVTAAPLLPPLQDPPTNLGAAGTRDAVILEVWRRSVNGYQVPAELIEPALGGPDTAERIETAYALRLYRLADGEMCRSIDLNDKLATHGHLTVTIAPTTMTSGDCPVVRGGGYTGLEHDLYRVEIADVDASEPPSFKWSQWNGGLVGRASFDATAMTLTLRSGDQAILRSGLTAFYLEALVFDTAAGHWRVAYGAPVTLDLDGDLVLPATATFGAPPDPGMITNPSDPADKTWFIRLWNGLEPIAAFPAGVAKELRDGIRLELSGSTFVAGDYWTFPVRAGLDNAPTLLADAPPFGVHHHRVPLAELHWTGPGTVVEDCRVPLHPITAIDGCCTHSVGDGVTSHGDFTSVQAAIEALPGDGGRVCVLPGTYTENVRVINKRRVEIIGCGTRSRIIAKNPSDDVATASPAIYVLDTSGIAIESLHVEGGRGGIAILLEEDAAAGTVGIESNQPSTPLLEDIRVAECTIVTGGNCGIEIRGGRRARLEHNHVSCANNLSDWALITVASANVRIQRNVVTVTTDKPGEYSALGGIWLRGGSTNIDVIDNQVTGGAGHGVMLGHAEQSEVITATGIPAIRIRRGLHWGFVFNGLLADDCVDCGPGTVVFPPPRDPLTPPWVAGDPLADIRIRGNSISAMGIAGIGVIGFFSDPKHGVIAIDRLAIANNRIFDSIRRGTAELEDGAVQTWGYGAISLADVSDLTVHDNEIRDNGTRALGQVCAIYVQHGSGVEVSRNRIYNNGPVRGHTAPSLPHGGVWLGNLMPPLEGDANTAGRLSAAVRDNEIHANNGPGLVMDGVGHYSIVANSITTRSSVGTAGRVAALNIVITNNSTARDVAWASFAGLRDRNIRMLEPAISFRIRGRTVPIADVADADLAGATITVKPPTRADAAYLPPPGSVVFADNHVITYSIESSAQSAVAIRSLADVTVSGNHFMTVAPSGWFQHPTPVMIFGADTHVHNNRFVDQSLFASVATWGRTNITTHNTADHCIFVTGQVPPIAAPNIERFGILCRLFGNTLAGLGITVGGIHP